jgi:hypothetical protein
MGLELTQNGTIRLLWQCNHMLTLRQIRLEKTEFAASTRHEYHGHIEDELIARMSNCRPDINIEWSDLTTVVANNIFVSSIVT